MLSNEGESAKMRQRCGKMSGHKRGREQQRTEREREKEREKSDGVH